MKAALRRDTRNILFLAPFVVAVMLAMTYVATIGVVVYIFISGLGYDWLDFSIPIIVIAVGTEYNTLMATRLREEFEKGVEPHEAAASRSSKERRPWLRRDHPGGTFASLLLTGIQPLEEIGAAVALGVLATRIVPTLATLRGFHFWWPHHTHTKTVANRDPTWSPT